MPVAVHCFSFILIGHITGRAKALCLLYVRAVAKIKKISYFSIVSVNKEFIPYLLSTGFCEVCPLLLHKLVFQKLNTLCVPRGQHLQQ